MLKDVLFRMRKDMLCEGGDTCVSAVRNKLNAQIES